MKLRSMGLAALGAGVALSGALFQGCGGGSGGGGFASTAAPVVSGVGPVSSGLPTAQRDPAGYDWHVFHDASTVAGGYVRLSSAFRRRMADDCVRRQAGRAPHARR